jgi:MFS superfamily sulfate permease-like transporter
LTIALQILASILHVGVLTKYLSDAIVNGFTTGAAYHVVASQLAQLLGVNVKGLHLTLNGLGLQFVIAGVRISL